MQPSNDQLKTYITSQTDWKNQQENISNQLLAAGWDKASIDQAFNELNTDGSVPVQRPKAPLALQIMFGASIVFLAMGVIMLLGGSYLALLFGGNSGNSPATLPGASILFVSLAGLLIFAALMSIVFFWLVWKARKGRKWALIALSVLAVLNVILSIVTSFMSQDLQLQALLIPGAFGLLLVNLWTRHREYFH